MSYERITKGLMAMGLTKDDVKIYLFLSTKGDQKIQAIAGFSELSYQELALSLKKLEDKGLVRISETQTTGFESVPLEEALDSLIKANLKDAQSMQKNKKAVVQLWESYINEIEPIY
jgi:sugar-specific transcriptional regulator TrmB